MGVRLDVEVRREPGPPSVGEVVSFVVTTGMNDEPLFLAIYVNSSLFTPVTAAVLAERPRGRVSCNGRSNEVNRKPDKDLTACSVEGLIGDRTAEERPLVVSTTVGRYCEEGNPRYERTASRICSRAVGRSWK